MEPGFWLERWERRETGFHLPDVNPHLTAYWPALALPAGSRVLVPLAGKSVDSLWLMARGHDVVAVELSPVAAEAFFAEAGLAPHRTSADGFVRYGGPGIEYLVGDFLTANPAVVGRVDAVYDRAALVALPSSMRLEYARRLSALQRAGTTGLLVTFEYEQAQMTGPPFAVPLAEVHTLFGATHHIDELATVDILDQEPRFKAKGLRALCERVFRLERR